MNDVNALRYCDISKGGNGSLITPNAMVIVGQNSFAEGKVSIRDCVFDAGTGSGLFINDQSWVVNFSNNTFSNNAAFAITLTTENLNDLNSNTIFSGNGKNYVEIRDCVTPEGESQTIIKLSIPYYLQQQAILYGNAVINPGVEFVHTANGFLATQDFNLTATSLNVMGTASQPVIFRGENGTSWKGIIIRSLGNTDFSYAEVRDGGVSPNVYGQQAGIIIENGSSTVSIRDCVIDNSGGWGIDLGGGQGYNSDIATANTFTNCAWGAVNY